MPYVLIYCCKVIACDDKARIQVKAGFTCINLVNVLLVILTIDFYGLLKNMYINFLIYMRNNLL